MGFVYIIIRLVALCLAGGFFVVEAKAFLNCFGHKDIDFMQAYKRTRNFWLLLTTIAAIVGLGALLTALSNLGFIPRMFLPFGGLGPLALLSIIAVVVAGVYLADVKPALPRNK